MSVEETLIIIKPDTVQKGLENVILDRFPADGLEIEKLFVAQPSEDEWRRHYADPISNYGAEIGERIVSSMVVAPCYFAVVRGEDAVARVRAMAGESTDPVKCSPSTIRGTYNHDSLARSIEEKRGLWNVIHTSDSYESAAKELNHWFTDYMKTSGVSLEPKPYLEIGSANSFTLLNAIKNVVNKSNEMRLLFHGRKRKETFDNVKKEGVKPVTPESGYCSFWSTGLALFYPTDDSPFFRYSGGQTKDSPKCLLNIAVSQYDLLVANGITMPRFVKDGQLCINQVVSPNCLAFMTSEIEYDPSQGHLPREVRKCAEADMLQLLTDIVSVPFPAGQSSYSYRKI